MVGASRPVRAGVLGRQPCAYADEDAHGRIAYDLTEHGICQPLCSPGLCPEEWLLAVETFLCKPEVRTQEVLVRAMSSALSTVGVRGARMLFEHRGVMPGQITERKTLHGKLREVHRG